MGSSDSSLGVCGSIFRFIFVIVNAFFALVGAGILAGGIYLVVTSQRYDVITGDSIVSGASLIIAAGALTLLIATVGCFGGLFKWRPLLALYAIIVAFIILLEIVAAIVGFYYHDKLEDRYQENWDKAIRDYSLTDENADTNKAVDFFQENFDCCGVNSPRDWGQQNPDYLNDFGLPDSCNCNDNDNSTCRIVSFTYNNGTSFTSNNTVWTEGCYNQTVDLGRVASIAVGSIGLVVGLSEVVSVIIAAGLIYCITKSKNEYQVV